MGNPYAHTLMDKDRHTAIDFGAAGVPETFVIDKQGVVRLKISEPLTPELIQTKILPLAAELGR
jgi:cytochrome c biogenesis protein CcmG/thiol:disulfide interchange protein DsbE